MLPSSFVVGSNLGIREPHPVRPIPAWAGLDDGGDHLHHRQDLSVSRVRLGPAFDLSDPLIERACPQPTQGGRSG
jgi:hypothetical protein